MVGGAAGGPGTASGSLLQVPLRDLAILPRHLEHVGMLGLAFRLDDLAVDGDRLVEVLDAGGQVSPVAKGDAAIDPAEPELESQLALSLALDEALEVADRAVEVLHRVGELTGVRAYAAAARETAGELVRRLW